MTHYAFVLGSNGSDAFGRLKYAQSDANRLAAALSAQRYSFTVTFPSHPADPYEIKRELDRAAKACSEDDALVIFFSGHGELLRGELMLVLDETVPGDETTYLPVAWIQEARARCVARNRLVILDCCHAGGAIGAKSHVVHIAELGIESKTEVMLLASNRLEIAREFEYLEGSFLTTEICSFLGNAPTETVGLSQLMNHMHSAALTHNRTASADLPRVPMPFLSGNQQGEFIFSIAAWPDLSRYVLIRDGGQSNSVVSLAAASALETSFAAQGSAIRLSAAYIREKTRKASEVPVETGEHIAAVVFILEQFGVLPENLWPWTAEYTERPPDARLQWNEIDSKAARYKARCFRLTGLEEVAAHLELKRPILAGIDCHNDNGWNHHIQHYHNEPGIITAPKRGSRLTGGHAIVIVLRDASGYKFANTWGIDWGAQGFATMTESVARTLINEDKLWAIEAIVRSRQRTRSRRR